MNSFTTNDEHEYEATLSGTGPSERNIPLNEGWRFKLSSDMVQGLFGGGEAFREVRLPHDAMRDQRAPSALSGPLTGYHNTGAIRYERDLDVPAAWADMVVLLEFEGVYRDARVYVNNALAAHHPFGYTGFTIALNPLVEFGQVNTIVVESRTHQDARWYSGAGIYRPVHLHVVSPAHLVAEDLIITTPDVTMESATVRADASLRNDSPHTRTVRMTATILDSVGSAVDTVSTPVTLRPGQQAKHVFRFFVNSPALWDVDLPNLYTAVLTLHDDREEIDRVTVGFGIRHLLLDPEHGLRINGRTVKLRGGAIHHDNGPLGAATIGRAEERRVQLLKEAGFNAIRMAHNPASKALLDACDRVGMLVINEAFDVWSQGKSENDYSLVFAEKWRDDLREMIVSSRNHPSVIMYSTGNEIIELASPAGAHLARLLASFARDLDPTRYITNALQLMWIGITDPESGAVEAMNAALGDQDPKTFREPNTRDLEIGRQTEEFASVLDVVGYNYAEERYLFDMTQFPGRIVFGSETFPSRIARYWPLVLKYSHVIGDFTWTAWDYLGEVGVGSIAREGDDVEASAFLREYPYLVAGVGDIDITGGRRPVSYYREIVFGLRKDPYIAVQAPELYDRPITRKLPWSLTDGIESWSWDGNEGRPVRVEVFAGGDEVALLLNGVEVGRSAVGANFPARADFETAWVRGALEAVAYQDGVEIGRHQLLSADRDVVITATADRSHLRSDDTDLAFIEIALQDANGTIHTMADRTVAVHVSGAGQLIALASADPATEERFDASERSTYRGRALAIVRPLGQGEIEVRISSDDFQTAEVMLRVGDRDE
jgi:beta-galactosidase